MMKSAALSAPRTPTTLLAIESSLLEQNAVAHEAMQTSLSRLALPRVGTLALGRNRKVVKAVFSADGQYLALLTTGIHAGEPTDGKILGVTFSPAAQYALAVEEPGRKRVWDLEMRRSILTVGGRTNEYAAQDITDVTQRSPIINVAFADDDRVFITARSDGVVSLWKRGANAGFGTFGVNFNDHAEAIRVSAGRNLTQVVLSPDGRYLMTTAGGNWMNPQGTMELADFKARLWDMSDGREIGRITSEGATGVAAISAARQLVATASAVPSIGDDGRATASIELGIWRLAANTERDRGFVKGPGADAMKAMKKPGGVLSLDGRRAAAATDDGLVLWDAAEGIRKIDLPASNRNNAENHRPTRPRSLRFSADSKTLMVTEARSAWAFHTGTGNSSGARALMPISRRRPRSTRTAAMPL
jgi:WD40 repeat protein